MDIYFHYLKIGYPDNIKQPKYESYCHVMFGVLNSKDRRSCLVCNDIESFNDRDKNKARKAFIMLYNHCISGLPLKDLYASSEGSYHEAFSVNINGFNKKVIRIRKGNIRIYFVFLGRRLVIFSVKVKNKHKLSDGEIKHLSLIVENIFKYEDISEFNKRLIK